MNRRRAPWIAWAGLAGAALLVALALAAGVDWISVVASAAAAAAVAVIGVSLAGMHTGTRDQAYAELAETLDAIRRDEQPREVRLSAPEDVVALCHSVAVVAGRMQDLRARSVRAHAALERAERERDELLTALRHELRTPLNAILGFADVLLREIDGPLGKDAQEDAQTIHAAGEHLLALFTDVLDLSALEGGTTSLAPVSCDVTTLLEDTVRLLEGQRKDKQVQLRVETIGRPHAFADPTRLTQVVTNLGTNALKATERGEIVFRSWREGDEVRVVVRDTGVGIARSELATLFEEYAQAGDLRRRHRGSGLGLAICRRLVELHGGRIWVESELGSGSSFQVALPAAKEDA